MSANTSLSAAQILSLIGAVAVFASANAQSAAPFQEPKFTKPFGSMKSDGDGDMAIADAIAKRAMRKAETETTKSTTPLSTDSSFEMGNVTVKPFTTVFGPIIVNVDANGATTLLPKTKSK